VTLRALHVVEGLAVRYGGTAVASAQLANQLAADGALISMLAFGSGKADAPAVPLDPRIVTRMVHRLGPRRIGAAAEARAALDGLMPVDVIHVHGLWRMLFAQAARFAEQHRIPLVLSVHGMLHAAALDRRHGLKRAARWLFQDDTLRRAACLHATAPDEADAIRRAGFRGRIAVIPWGVAADDRDEPAATAPPRNGLRTVLYLGRLHPSKGLEELLGAWSQVHGAHPAWRLVLAGYDQDGYRGTLEGLASALGVSDAVAFAGPVVGHARERFYADADLVVLPSPAENFGLVVPEALARGVPVIATQGAPWRSLVTEDCGWWTPSGREGLAAALNDALGRDAGELRAMGERGRRFALEHFTWRRAAKSMRALYLSLAGDAAVPGFVQ
jgi:glycosyltransferase involved in cell wall biosynthesis